MWEFQTTDVKGVPGNFFQETNEYSKNLGCQLGKWSTYDFLDNHSVKFQDSWEAVSSAWSTSSNGPRSFPTARRNESNAAVPVAALFVFLLSSAQAAEKWWVTFRDKGPADRQLISDSTDWPVDPTYLSASSRGGATITGRTTGSTARRWSRPVRNWTGCARSTALPHSRSMARSERSQKQKREHAYLQPAATHRAGRSTRRSGFVRNLSCNAATTVAVSASPFSTRAFRT